MLQIEDDGQGFELPSRWAELAREGHLGLVGMVERIRAVDGRASISSAPGKGTSIRVTMARNEGSFDGHRKE
jgi:two-component system sensor histidine kinase UhpB